MLLYEGTRKLLAQGATPWEALEAFLIADAREPMDLRALDAYELENVQSIQARAIDDAIEGRAPCPIWGDF
jgi:hypothetical protein